MRNIISKSPEPALPCSFIEIENHTKDFYNNNTRNMSLLTCSFIGIENHTKDFYEIPMHFPYELGSISNIGLFFIRGQLEYQILLWLLQIWIFPGDFRASDITLLVGHKLSLQSESDISTSTSTGKLTFWICISHACPRDFSRLISRLIRNWIVRIWTAHRTTTILD